MSCGCAVCHLSTGAGADTAGGVPHGHVQRDLGLLGADCAQGGLVLFLQGTHTISGEILKCEPNEDKPDSRQLLCFARALHPLPKAYHPLRCLTPSLVRG